VGYLGLKAGASILGNMGSSLGASLVSKLLAGKVGQSIGGNAASSLSAGVIAKGIGKNIGTAISGAIKMTTSAISNFGAKIGTGLSGALASMPGGSLVSAAFPFLAIAGIGAAIGFAMWKRHKDLQAGDDVLKDMTQLEQLDYLTLQVGLSNKLSKEFLKGSVQQGGTMNTSEDMVANFELFANMERQMREFGKGYVGLEEQYKVDFSTLSKEWRDFFVDKYLGEKGMMPKMMSDVRTEMGPLLISQTQKQMQDVMGHDTHALLAGGGTMTQTGPNMGYYERPGRGEVETKESSIETVAAMFGLTRDQMNIYNLGGTGYGQTRQNVLSRFGSQEGMTPQDMTAAGFSSRLVSTQDTGGPFDGTFRVFVTDNRPIPAAVLKWLEEEVKTNDIILGPEITRQMENMELHP